MDTPRRERSGGIFKVAVAAENRSACRLPLEVSPISVLLFPLFDFLWFFLDYDFFWSIPKKYPDGTVFLCLLTHTNALIPAACTRTATADVVR
jgi:hypothetical protein